MRIAIIGAGMAGLSCAKVLNGAGHDITIFEKSRGIGGRLATRRTPDGLKFDHGAQFFTVRTEPFREFLAGETLKWPARRDFAQDKDWHMGAPDMKSFLRTIAGSLNIQLETRIEAITFDDGQWRLGGQGTELGIFDRVIITAPSVQVQALTEFSPRLQSQLSAVHMAPCWTFMLTLNNPSVLDRDAYRNPQANLAWLSRNSSKAGRAATPECWVAHASPQWSTENLELDKEQALQMLLPEICQFLDASMDDLIYFSAHRWRYAKVTKPLGAPFISDETGTMFAAGDWCLGARVEDAFTSGYELAQHLLKS